MRTATLRTTVSLAAGIGLIVSVFAALEFYDASLQNLCSFNGFFSCQTIAQSGRTTFLLVPDWAWGIAGFLAILVVASLAEARVGDRRRAYALVAVTTLGAGFAVYLGYVELVQIGALCIVCFSAYAFGFIAWAGAIALARGPQEEPDASDVS